MTDQSNRLAAALTGRYRIERELGVGGMATVYLAADLKHDRKVAIKVLKPELAAVLGAERFVVEIKTTASLQHPHILPLFDSGTADGFLFYVMPYVQGETIREKLNRETQFGIDEAVRIAREVADALDYAHRHGVIHRDIKPENILLHDGRAIVMDFGIALAVSAAAGGRMTETGLSLGTPHYMSPEQATAEKEITPKSDVYSLASVLYEMLAGQPPHVGGAAQQVIMKIIAETAQPVNQFRKNVPPNVAGAVARALEKLPADRFDSAKAFGDALGNPAFSAPGALAAAPAQADSGISPRLFRATLAVAVVAVAAVAWLAVAIWRGGRDVGGTAKVVVLTSVTLPRGAVLDDGAPGANFTLSPQGDRLLAWSPLTGRGVAALFVRRTDQLEWKELLPVAGRLRTPCFSPDGHWIAFVLGNDVEKVSVDGSGVVRLATLPSSPHGIAWGPRGSIVAGTVNGGLFVIPEGGGEARAIPKATDERRALWPVFLPGGDAVAYLADGSGGAGRHLSVVRVSGGARTPLKVGDAAPVGYLAGHLVYATTAGALMALPFDADALRVTGPPVPLLQDVIVDTEGGAKASLSGEGSLIFRRGKTEMEPVLVHAGASTPLTKDLRAYATPRFSPDGRRVAFTVSGSPYMDVWVFDRDNSTLTRITNEGTAQRPEWFPDGKRLLFVSDRGARSAVWSQVADGSAPAELLYSWPDADVWEGVISPDGQWLVFRTGPGGPQSQKIFSIPIGGKGTPTLLAGGTVTLKPRLSPDGHWLAYASSESGQAEVYVRPFPENGGRVQVSVGGGSDPIWGRSGKVLYYSTPPGLTSVAVTPGATFSIGARATALEGAYEQTASHPNYDVLPDGSGFLMLRRAGEEVQTILVHNWVRELMAKTAAAK